MAYFSVVLVLLGHLLYSATGQPVVTCDDYSNLCVNGNCELQPNQQQGCTCNPGYILDPTYPLHCHPIPSCNLLQGTPDQQCLNGMCQQQTSGGFSCACYPGYQTNIINPNICENVDECRLPYSGCVPGSCTDVIGDYMCTACMPGYILDQRAKCQRIIMNQPSQVPQAQAQAQGQGQNQASQWLLPFMMDSVFF